MLRLMRVPKHRFWPLLLLLLSACERETVAGPAGCDMAAVQTWLASSELRSFGVGIGDRTVNVNLPEDQRDLSESLQASLEEKCGDRVAVRIGGVPKPV